MMDLNQKCKLVIGAERELFEAKCDLFIAELMALDSSAGREVAEILGGEDHEPVKLQRLLDIVGRMKRARLN
jgi:hypothetical protein